MATNKKQESQGLVKNREEALLENSVPRRPTADQWRLLVQSVHRHEKKVGPSRMRWISRSPGSEQRSGIEKRRRLFARRAAGTRGKRLLFHVPGRESLRRRSDFKRAITLDYPRVTRKSAFFISWMRRLEITLSLRGRLHARETYHPSPLVSGGTSGHPLTGIPQDVDRIPFGTGKVHDR